MKPGQAVMIRTYVAGTDPYTVVKGDKAMSSKVEYTTIDMPAFVLHDFGDRIAVLYLHNNQVEQRWIPWTGVYNWKDSMSIDEITRNIQNAFSLGHETVAIYWTLRLTNKILYQ